MNRFKKIGSYILFLLLLQEICFRICFPVPEIKNLDRSNYSDIPNFISNEYLRDKKWSWQSLPDTNTIFIHHMNRYGFRDHEWKIAQPSNTKRALFIGDSFIEGIMAEQHETIPETFKNYSSNTYEVMNAGTLGRGINTYSQMATDLVPIYKPDVAFLCIYANDLSNKKPYIPEYYLIPEYYKWYTPRLYVLIDQALNNTPILFRWHHKTQSFFSGAEKSEQEVFTKEDREKLLPHVTPELLKAVKKGTFVPYRIDALRKEVTHLSTLPQLGDAIPYFKYICNNNNVIPVVIYIPSRNQTTKHYLKYERELNLQYFNDTLDLTKPRYQTYQRALQKECNTHDVLFFNLTQVVKNEETKNNHLYWNYDEHMKAKGYQVLGKTIWKQWKQHQ